MITLQAEPLIQWDETIQTLQGQTSDAQKWIAENILNTTPAVTNETVHSIKENVDWDRIKIQDYTANGFNLVVTRTYQDAESCAISSATYILTQI